MGLSPAAYYAIASVAGPAIGGLLNGLTNSSQERKSFEGTDADPVKMISEMHDLLGKTGRGLADRAATPISLPSAYVQQPGAYSGGGLPMPIGLVASDPALRNPSLLNRPGMGEFQGLFSNLGSGGTPFGQGGTGPVTPDGQHGTPTIDHGNPPGVGDPLDPNSRNNPSAPFGPDGPDFNAAPDTTFDPTGAFTGPHRIGVDDWMAPHNFVPGAGGDEDPNNIHRNAQSESRTDFGMPSRPKLIRGADLLNADAGNGDDLMKGSAAAQLLLHALGMDTGQHGSASQLN